MWGNVDIDDGIRRERELLQTSQFWGEMVKKGSEVFRHDDSQQSALAIIDNIIQKNKRVILDLQDQMVNQGRKVNETEAGKEVESALLKEREKFERRLRENEKELKQALKDRDEESTRELMEIQEQYRNQIASSTKAIEDMRISMQRLHEQKEQAFQREIEQMKAQRKMDEENLRERGMQLDRLAEEIRTTQAYTTKVARQERAAMEKFYLEQRTIYVQDTTQWQKQEDTRRQRAATRAGVVGAGAGVASVALALLPALACNIM